MALMLTVSGWIAAAPAPASDTAPGVTVTNAWIRWLPANLPAGGYLTLHNNGDRTQTLTAVSSPDYRNLTLHRTSTHDNVSTMQPVPRLAIPPHQSVNFAAGGYHIMLERATRSLQPGDRVSMTLHFADGSALTVPFDVRRPDAGDLP
jgi:copper(I)-binding protein